MKKIIIFGVLHLMVTIINAQIGLLQTNSFIKEKNYDFNSAYLFDKDFINYSDNLLQKELKSFLRENAERSNFSGNSQAKKYFLEAIEGRSNKFKDSLNEIKALSKTFNQIYTSTEFKMWNYFSLFEDSSKVVKDYKTLVDSIGEEDGYLDSLSYKKDFYRNEIIKLDNLMTQMSDSLRRWSDSTYNMTTAMINLADANIQVLLNKIKDIISVSRRDLKSDIETLGKHQKTYNGIISRFFKEKSNTSDKDFGALPQVTSIIGERETVPAVQLLGSKKFGDKETDFIVAEMGLMLGMQSNPEKPNLKTLFVDQASTFHLFTQFNYGFGIIGEKNETKKNFKRLALNLHFSYNIKKILTDTAKTTKIISPSLFHTQTGIELAILPKALTIYGNVNTLTIFDKYAEFKSALNVTRKFFGYIDCGAKILLDPEQTLNIKNAKLFINANFIINSSDIKYITKTEDLITPNIQIGIKASF